VKLSLATSKASNRKTVNIFQELFLPFHSIARHNKIKTATGLTKLKLCVHIPCTPALDYGVHRAADFMAVI
jgi:hypothetical protein